MARLTISNLDKRFGAFDILKDVNLEIPSGEFVVFVGPSGCGKSTLLRCISGLEAVSGGTLSIDGVDVTKVPPSQRGIAMVFQSYALYPHMSVFDNMAYALKIQKLGKAEIEAKVRDAARKLQLDLLLDRLPRQLSGGQRQRVAIGRAIVRDPKVFLFDEPLSNLDAALRVQTRLEIAALKQSLPGTTMIYVTHDQVEAMTLADRIVVLNAGRVEQVGTPLELYERPGSVFVAGFIGSPKMNLLAGAEAAKFGAATIGVRPEHLAFGQPGEGWAGTVMRTEHLGSESYVYVDVGSDEPMIVRTPGTAAFAQGDAVALTADEGAILRFDAGGSRLA
ncbi:ABC transporter ATP-binding protein [Devosia psychrophila]|uniref:Glycerol-3-phosphate ABC transporter ATPase n=1 Tax=Devosia psychrophila TaxID=728005 RepID=A0A0F5Q1E2_9HYPH|nr:ATP-binding cassette domain-containing protein [Devosia psychrophila]KKC33899.1 glycerol-3-phosphate ABC transporter ATPase [Devosia psychrophila]SFD11281.1 multiple sugar transport system ATP-binding protein [Devosia psychrophila]